MYRMIEAIATINLLKLNIFRTIFFEARELLENFRSTISAD